MAVSICPTAWHYLSPTTFKIRSLPSPEAACSSNLPLVDIKSKGEGTQYLYAAYLPGQSVSRALSEQHANRDSVHQRLSPWNGVFLAHWSRPPCCPPVTSGGLARPRSSTIMVTMFAKVPAVTPAGRLPDHDSHLRGSRPQPESQFVSIHPERGGAAAHPDLRSDPAIRPFPG